MTAQTETGPPVTDPVLAPPARAYSDPAVLADELASVWRTSWVVAGLTADVATPKSYLSVDLAGVPVVVTRDREGTLHALSNVCRHRGMILSSGCGPAMALSCPNHAWTYGLDGRLKGAPRSSVEEDFDPASIRLPEYAVVEWGPFVLVNLDADAEPPLAELALMDATLAAAGLDLATMRQSGEVVDWSIAANWKIVVENYLECYHCSWVHKDFSTVFDVVDYRYAAEPVGDMLISTAPVRSVAEGGRQQELLATDGPLTDSHWYLLFPGATVNLYPGAGAVELTWYWPVDADTTGARTVVLVAPDATPEYERQVTDLLMQVGEEDNAVCEGMHRGMRSGALERVRVLPGNEPLISSFHALLAKRLTYQEVAR
ncbi:aromatic ring-hydroxylating dioxygenase subunit alpha [Nocardioides sp. CN2-186]|uniref:aromatic ring-hydroxylating oxygenase subunit alpha n=1 Tax=Nocardioides tweenelious TaxID=3156607 RepID=UPI0032B324C2